jgi:preprotein translocase SecE subunit
MKTGTLFKKWTAALCAVLMMISLFAIPAFAEEATENTDKPGISTGTLIGLIIGAVVLVVAVVLCIRFRENIGKFFRVYKSEAKKIVWLPWSQTKKSTLVVLVVLIAFAVAICLIDLALSRSFLKFVELFSK